MKKSTALICLLAFATITFAQPSFQLGLQLSPNLSWIKPDTETIESDGNKFGFSYGIIGDFNIAANYAFSTGISILSNGGKVDYPDIQTINNVDVAGRSSVDLRIKYVQVPLTLKLKTNEIGYMKYYGQFGFGLGAVYDTKADVDFNYPGSNSSYSNEEVDFQDEINLFRASLIVGLGAEYNLSGNTSLIFGLTFDNGFTNIFSEDGYHEDVNGNANPGLPKDKSFKAINNSLVLNLGVIF